MTQCCIALGANLADPTEQFASALAALDSAGQRVITTSQNHITPAMGSEAGGDFHNAAAVVDTSLPPAELLQLLHSIEAKLGRERTIVWGPRSLDLDLLFYADQVMESTSVVVPHPAIWYRRFVLAPLNEIAAAWVHPTLGQTVSELLQHLNQSPLQLEIPHLESPSIARLYKALHCDFTNGSFDIVQKAAHVPFATILIEDQSPRVHRVQPNTESTRVIRIPASDDTDVFLRNILTAALPHDQLLAD